jgi:hypothetical protein
MCLKSEQSEKLAIDEFGRLATEASKLGLALSGLHWEGGDSDNGIRLFRLAPGEAVNHSRGDHTGHCRTVGEVESFLAGYKHGLEKAG